MKDDSSSASSPSLREEWSLLVHSFLEDPEKKTQILKQLKSDSLGSDRLKNLKRDLSQRRKKLNQSIEIIKAQIEQITVVVENLALVGSDASGLQAQIEELNREGSEISEEITKLDAEIKKIREIQEQVVL